MLWYSKWCLFVSFKDCSAMQRHNSILERVDTTRDSLVGITDVFDYGSCRQASLIKSSLLTGSRFWGWARGPPRPGTPPREGPGGSARGPVEP